MKKYLIFASFFSIINYSNELDTALAKLNTNAQAYQNKQKILKAIDERNSNLIKENLGIISGKKAAAQNIVTEFNYYQNSTYQIFTKVGFTTALELNSDEEIIYIGGGDTENWQIDIANGAENNSSFVFIKPLFDNLKTNLTIITTKRRYILFIESTYNDYNPLIKWKYPYDKAMKFKTNLKEGKKIENLNISNSKDLNFNYKFDKNSKISPNTVYDDGIKTIIVLKQNTQEVPVVYVYGEDNQLSIVNYRILGNNIIIDKIANKFQMILGKEILDIVRQ